jgi:hypothetical protein
LFVCLHVTSMSRALPLQQSIINLIDDESEEESEESEEETFDDDIDELG